ncbi:hypothetical protein Pla175_01610 [Pirellulimonas nuda]|uniref:YetF C-terminal domain-containing protein n=1 Tax=Pirellulimonas nuda TaxID=2528009 RepID=A0A518D5Q7_9BACT|nr:YetF domain-containing protein [Pirellulimonas nuda]QDU86808.1 hypothetical protein Pla175_01610 [Pirellulimonas nuda]
MTLSAGYIAAVVGSSALVYAVVLLCTRLAGLRSFSKMSASDFAMTVAVGSLFASTAVSPDKQLIPGLVAIATLFSGQLMIAVVRKNAPWASDVIDNQPLLLMRHGKIIDANMQQAHVTRADLFAKLREANACKVDDVLAVVFETTGDISVLHSDTGDLDPEILEGVLHGAHETGA